METPPVSPLEKQEGQRASITPDPTKPESTTGISEHMLFAALCYVGVLIVVPWLTHRDDPYVQFHLKQGLVILAGFILALLAAQWVSVVGSMLFLVLLILDVIALVQALLGRRWKIPFIGQLADQFRI